MMKEIRHHLEGRVILLYVIKIVLMRDSDVQAMLAEAITANEGIREDEKKKHEEFAKKRKAHYNEFRVIKGTDRNPSPNADGNKNHA
jgi:hypothetical protein